jgi:hypothetical protein
MKPALPLCLSRSLERRKLHGREMLLGADYIVGLAMLQGGCLSGCPTLRSPWFHVCGPASDASMALHPYHIVCM